MTDARLRGEWIGKIKFDNLTDTAWRVFTTGLLWSAEQGTDGHIPTRYLRTLHPDGEKPAAVRELAQAGLWETSANGVQFIDWAGKLGQSTALEVETAKAQARERQRRYRESQRLKTAEAVGFTDTTPEALRQLADTRDVTRHVTRPDTGDVGEGEGEGEGQVLSGDSETFDQQTGEVLDWPTAEIPAGDWGSADAPGNVIGARS